MWLRDRGSYRRNGHEGPVCALFWSFHVVLWLRKQSQEWPREPWTRPEGPLVAPRPFGLPNAHSEKKLEHSLASCRKTDFRSFSWIFSTKLPRKPWKRTFLEFSRGSEAAGAIAEVAAEALAAHFSRVSRRFCGRGGSRRSGRGSPDRAQKAHWSLRDFFGSQMLILKRNWSTLWRPVEKLIFLDFP